jgi:hypothetical protein
MAGPTRLELATSGVTGRRSNQLNYDPDESANERPLGARAAIYGSTAGTRVSIPYRSFFQRLK